MPVRHPDGRVCCVYGCRNLLWAVDRCQKCYQRRRRAEARQLRESRRAELEKARRDAELAEQERNRAEQEHKRELARAEAAREMRRREVGREWRAHCPVDREGRIRWLADQLGLVLSVEVGRPASDQTQSKVFFKLSAPTLWGGWTLRWLSARQLDKELKQLWAADVECQQQLLIGVRA